MKKSNIFFTLTASLLLSGNVNAMDIVTPNIPINQESNTSKEKLFAPHEAIVLFTKESNFADLINKMQTLFDNFTYNEYSLINGMHIIIPSKSYDEIKKLLESMPGVKSVEPNYKQLAFKSNDSYYDKLWAIENNGQSVNNKSGTKDADMDVAEAWTIEKGESDVVVAVLDTGVDYTHNDLADNMWSGTPNHGYDFAGDNDGNNDDNPMPDTPYDEKGHYHGTHVAGTIGAVGDNSNGVSGVAQSVQIMAVKVFRPNGYGYSSDILEGLDYVGKEVDKGVKVVAVNASYGGGGGKPGDSMDQAIQKLGDKGVVFCAAAGNNGKDIDNDPVYPAAYSATNIITVAASDQDDKLASFSNYGKKTVEVAAPGTNILSTYPENKYAYLQGTSMATPNVSGTIALLASENPDSSVDERIEAIVKNVDTKSALTDKVSSNGRVNTYNAVKSLDNGSDENKPPKANDDSAATPYETKITIDVLKNDSDDDGDRLTLKSVTKPSNGEATINVDKVDYMPRSGFSGTDTFKYTVSDGKGGEANAEVTVTVDKKTNTPPKANDDSATTDYDKAVIIDVLKNDSDAEEDTLAIKSLTAPSHGVAEKENGKVKYTPNIGYSGTDSFEYTISDGNGGEDKAKVTVTIQGKGNTPPEASDDSATTEYEKAVDIDVLKNDSDEDGDTLTIKSHTNPKHGVAKIEDRKIKYTPKAGYSGEDSFEYTITDGNSAEDTATVKIKIKEKKNTPPKANDDKAVTEYETAVVIDVVKNDSDADADKLTVKSLTKPKNGVAKIENGKINYNPNAAFSGTDTFTYTLSDGNGGEDKATVTVTVKEKPNTPPKANSDSAKTQYETKIIIDVLKNDSDEDKDTLSIKSVGSPEHGIAAIKSGKVEYTPEHGFSGNDTFTYTISDGKGGESSAGVTVIVDKKPNTPPEANDDSAVTEYSKSVIIDVIKNDNDADGDTLSIKSHTNPKNGIVLIEDKDIKYTPNSGFSGADSFKYTVSDGKGGEATAVVTVKVKEKENTPPVAKDDTVTTDFNKAVVIDVLKNDSDADSDSLTIKGLSNPEHGSVAVESGKVKYNPKEDYSGEDNFEYTVSDGKGGEDKAKVKVFVKEKADKKNTPPVAKDDTITTDFNMAVVIDVLKNDSDADGDILTVKSLGEPRHGNTVIEKGKVKYIPKENYSGEDSFEYIVSDGKGGEAKAEVKVIVKEKADEKKNHPPVAEDDIVKTAYMHKVSIDVLKNDSDIDGDNLTITNITDPKNGIIKVENGQIEYTPNKDFSGEESFKYTIKDTEGAEATAAVIIEVAKKENTPPIAKDDKVVTDYETKIIISVLSNDSDADGDSLIIKSVSQASNGSVKITKESKIEYMPNKDFSGTDNFKYTISDSRGGEVVAGVEVTVKKKKDNVKNHLPIARNDSEVIDFNTTALINVLSNDSDIDGDSFKIKSISQPKNGKAVLKGNKIEYTPNSDYSGADTFGYTIEDAKGAQNSAKVTIMVKAQVGSSDGNEFHFPIIGKDGIESSVHLMTKFTKLETDKFTEFKLSGNRADIKVAKSGEIDLKSDKAPLPKTTLPAGTKLDIDKDKLIINIKANKNIWF